VILGTAGHVDHGKTALVRALTGVDTDRLPDERRRGITIDLGFAPLRLDGLPPLSIVDVPGHEAFVRNMLAGATGIDMALLVIAADEGVMQQTREHLLILSLLGVSSGVIALTKADLVEEEWLALVQEDVAALMRGTPLADAPVVAVSATTGLGLEALREAIAAGARARPEREARDLFRMPVDRVFTVRGTGTVVTGTVWSGTLVRDETVRLMPDGRAARVRGLQSHGEQVERAGPGTRVAVALATIEVAEIARGATLVTDPGWRPASRWIADVALDREAGAALGPRTAVRLHLGTHEVGARIVSPGGALVPGGRAVARIVLDAPAVARAGDRFVLRAPAPLRTIGGGVILDPLPPHRRQRATAFPGSPGDRLEFLVREAGRAGLLAADLPVRLGVPPEEVPRLVGAAAVLRAGALVVAESVIAHGVDDAIHLVDAFHEAEPLEAGFPVQALRARIGGAPEIAEAVIRRAVDGGQLCIEGAAVLRPGWVPRLAPAWELEGERVLEAVRAAGREPPSVDELTATVSAHAFSMLKFFEREGRVVQVSADRFYDGAVLAEMTDLLKRAMRGGGEASPQEIRDVLGLSRKFLIPFLEYCDRTGVTERRANGRVLAGSRGAEDRQVLA
jgi:selenocysteine-specific elongation factor